MVIDTNALHALPAAEKLRLVEWLWDDLCDSSDSLPLPAWIDEEIAQRRAELLKNPAVRLSHEETWARINARHGLI